MRRQMVNVTLSGWLLFIGSVSLSTGCASGPPLTFEVASPSCEDQCMLDEPTELAACLRSCGGGDFTASLGCQEDDHRDLCYPPAPDEATDDGGFISTLFDVVGSVADAVVNADRSDDGDHDAHTEETTQAEDERKLTRPRPPPTERTPAKPSQGSKPSRTPAKPSSK